jgi:hypothetical protein
MALGNPLAAALSNQCREIIILLVRLAGPSDTSAQGADVRSTD